MGLVAQTVTHAITSVVQNVTKPIVKAITQPSKLTIGDVTQIATGIPSNPASLGADAAIHPQDRPILAAAAATGIAVGVAGAFAGTATAGTGAASTLGMAKSIPSAIQTIDTVVGGGGGGGGPVAPPSSPQPSLSLFGPTGPGGGGDFGVWATGDSGGGNVFANPVASGTTSPVPMTTTYLILGAAFLLLLMPMLAKKGR